MLSPAELLGRHRLFEGVSANEIDALAKKCAVRTYAPREFVFMKDDPGDGVFGVLCGRVEISTSSNSGKEVIFASMLPGDIFGEIAVFDGAGRTANASAIQNSQLLFLPKEHFFEFARSHATILLHMIEVLCLRLRRTTASLEDTAFLDVAGRTSKWLLANAPSGRTVGSASIKITQASLAREIGASREIVSRQLQIWKKSKLLSINRNQIIIHKIEAFRLLAARADAYD